MVPRQKFEIVLIDHFFMHFYMQDNAHLKLQAKEKFFRQNFQLSLIRLLIDKPPKKIVLLDRLLADLFF